MTEQEAYALSTAEEKAALDQYNAIRSQGRMHGYVTETQLLRLSQIMAVIEIRNARLGLQPAAVIAEVERS